MAEARNREDIRDARRQIVRGRGLFVLVFLRSVQRLRAQECGAVGVLAVDQGHDPRFGKLAFAAVADRKLGRAFHIGGAIAGIEIMHRQRGNLATRGHTANLHRPAIFFMRAVDVDRHRMGGVHPSVLLALVAVGGFFKIELFHRLAILAVRRACQDPRHRQRDIARVFRVAQRVPTGIIGCVEHRRQIARVAQLVPAVHPHQGRRGRGDEGCMGGGGNLAQIAQQAHVAGGMVERKVTDQRPKRLAAQLAKFSLVDLLEQRALVPFGPRIAAQFFVQLGLRDVHHLQL